MKRYITIVLLLSALSGRMWAQNDDTVVVSDSRLVVAERPVHLLTDTNRLLKDDRRWQFHLALGSALVGSNTGSASVFTVAPTVIYRPSERLTFKASVASIQSFSLAPDGYAVMGHNVRSLAPYRYPASAGAVNVSMAYKVNERLTVAASLFHAEGQIASSALMNPWFASGMPMDMNLTAFSAALRYRLREDTFIDMHMTVINDPTGVLGPLYWGGPYGAPFEHLSAYGRLGSFSYFSPFEY